jgi:hypothetical protein
MAFSWHFASTFTHDDNHGIFLTRLSYCNEAKSKYNRTKGVSVMLNEFQLALLCELGSRNGVSETLPLGGQTIGQLMAQLEATKKNHRKLSSSDELHEGSPTATDGYTADGFT